MSRPTQESTWATPKSRFLFIAYFSQALKIWTSFTIQPLDHNTCTSKSNPSHRMHLRTPRLACRITSPPNLHHARPINEPQTAPSCQPSAQHPIINPPGLPPTHRFVRSLYRTRCPQSLHRIGSPFFSCTFWLHSPQRYCVVGPASSTAVRKAEPAVVPAVVVWLEPAGLGGV